MLTTLIQVYPCLVCNTQERIKLATHLQRNQECRQVYVELFKLENVIDISLQVTKLKKKSYLSRQPEQRAVENKSKIMMKMRDEDFCVNKFNLNTSFANVFKCIVCKLHLSKDNTKRLKVADLQQYVIDANDRRFGEFYICRICEKNPRQENNVPIDELETNICFQDEFSIHRIKYRNRDENNLENINMPRSPQVSQDDQLIRQHGEFIEGIENETNINPDMALDALIDNIQSQVTQHDDLIVEIETDNNINTDLALDALIENLPESSQPGQDYPLGENGDYVEQLENNNQNLCQDQPLENTPRSSQINQVYSNNNFEGSQQSSFVANYSEDHHLRIIAQK